MDISRETHDDLIGAIEDSLAFTLEEARKGGEWVSGECAWNVVWAYSTAKVAEFEGLIEPETVEDTEHF